MKKIFFTILTIFLFSFNAYSATGKVNNKFWEYLGVIHFANGFESITINGKNADKMISNNFTESIMGTYGSTYTDSKGYLSMSHYNEIGYGYQCVGFVKAIAPVVNTWTGNWKRKSSERLSKYNLPPKGTIIATFNNYGRYYGHVAVFMEGNSKGIYVVDQNWEDKTGGINWVGRIHTHFIPFNGKGLTNNASNYYVVNVN